MILDELKSMAIYGREEAEDIKYGMDKMNEILQANINIMKEISSSHMKVTNDIIDRIEAQLRSPDTNDTIGYEHVDTKQVQTRKAEAAVDQKRILLFKVPKT